MAAIVAWPARPLPHAAVLSLAIEALHPASGGSFLASRGGSILASAEALEEAIAIHDAVEIERKVTPDAVLGDLVEKVGAERGFNGMVARNLVALLKTPPCLRSAVMKREIGREVAFELTRYWNKLLGEQEQQNGARREIKFRNLVAAWAAARGLELDPQAMTKYAAETFQDPKAVKATCRKAEECEKAVAARFAAIVERVRSQRWTVAKAKAMLTSGVREDRRGVARKPLFERAGKGGSRLTVHLERIRDSARAADPMLKELLVLLRAITRDVEAACAEGARSDGGAAAEVSIATTQAQATVSATS